MIPEYAKGMQPDDMPDTLARELAAVFGVEMTLRLLEAQGGVTAYFPKVSCLPEGCQRRRVEGVRIEDLPTSIMKELAEQFGIEQAIAFVKFFDGAVVYLPKLSSTLSACRNRKIVEEYFQGENTRTLCRKYGVTQSYIMRLVAASEKRRITQ